MMTPGETRGNKTYPIKSDYFYIRPAQQVERAVFRVSGPVTSVEGPILNSFAQMARCDICRVIEIGNGARDFQDAVVCAGRKAEPRDRCLQQLLAICGNRAVLADQFGRHLCVGIDAFFGCESFELTGARADHAIPNRSRIFGSSLSAQFLVLDRRDFDMNVNSIEQRAGNFRYVSLNLRGCAMAFAGWIAEEATGTGIHRRGQHEPGGESNRKRGAGDRYSAFLERLAQDLQDIPLKLRQLVQEQNAVMPQGDFAGPGHCSTADQSGIADGVVWRPERPSADQAARILQHSRYAMDSRRLDGFIKGHGWQDGGNSFGQHRFAGARRSQEDDVVAAGASHFESSLGALLTTDVTQIQWILRGLGQQCARIEVDRLEGFRCVNEINGLRKGTDCVDLDPFDDGGFAGIGFRHHDTSDALFPGTDCGGERTSHRPHAAVERQFAEEELTIQRLAEKRALASQNAERHWQIKPGTFLANIGGREIDRDALWVGEFKAAVFQR